MKSYWLGAGVAVAALVATPAAAQDAAGPFAGPYVGAQLGIGQIDDLHDDLDYWYDGIGEGRGSDRGIQAGVRAGYDFQSGSLLAGILAETSFGELDAFHEKSSGGDADPDQYKIGTRTTWLGSVRAKVGLTSGNVAAYATGGIAFSNGKVKFRETDGTDEEFDGKADRTGYVLGLGAAYAIGGRSNIALDYSHYEFGSTTSELLEPDGSSTDYFFRQDYKVRTLMLSWNYGFGANAATASATPATAGFAGPYVGGQLAIADLHDHHTDLDYWYTNTDQSQTDDRGIQAGIRAGYDFVSGNLIAGVLGEVSFGKLNSFQEVTGAGEGNEQYAIGTRLTMLGSVRGKVGVASGNLAAFVTGGIAFSNAKQKYRETDGTGQIFDGKGDRTGYVLGLGAAWALNDRMTVGLDYSHYEFGDKTHEVLESDGDPEDYFFEQKYKVRTLGLSFNYGF